MTQWVARWLKTSQQHWLSSWADLLFLLACHIVFVAQHIVFMVHHIVFVAYYIIINHIISMMVQHNIVFTLQRETR